MWLELPPACVRCAAVWEMDGTQKRILLLCLAVRLADSERAFPYFFSRYLSFSKPRLIVMPGAYGLAVRRTAMTYVRSGVMRDQQFSVVRCRMATGAITYSANEIE